MASLTSHGLTAFKGLRLEGQFRYQKSFRDGIGWKLGRQVYHQPYYFANIKPGDWDNDRYALDLRGGTSLFGDHLLLAAGADYQVERLARYNDPRPSINYYNLFLKGQVGVRLGRHTFALYAGSGDAEENGVVGNYNRAHDSFGEREYNIITTTGMGSYNLVRFNAYKKPSSRSEIGATYDFDGDGLQFTGELVGRRSQTEFTRQVSDTRQTPGRYHEREVHGRAFVTVSRANYTLQARSTTRYRSGYDYNEVFAGANYFHAGLRQTLDLFFHTRPDHLTLQAKLDYSSQSFTDRNASHHYEYAWLAPGLSAQYSLEAGVRQYTFIPGATYRLPLSQEARVPEKNRNLYTSYVLAPDYYLHTSGVGRIRGAFQVLQQFGRLSVGLLLDYRRRVMVSNGSVLGRPDFLPGNARNTFSLTLQFFH